MAAVVTKSTGGNGHPPCLFRYPGGKSRLAPWIYRRFPGHVTYVEPFAGAANVFLQKERTMRSVLIDSNPLQVALLTAVRDRHRELMDRLRPLRWTQETWEEARDRLDSTTLDPLERAVAHYTFRRLSRDAIGGYSRMHSKDQQATWDNSVRRLPEVARKLQGAEILQGSALDLIKRFDSICTLFYLDPPYLHSTRGAKNLYPGHEMSDDDHLRLLRVARRLKGRVAISGYRSELYDRTLGRRWRSVEKEVWQGSQRGETMTRTEVLWLNF